MHAEPEIREQSDKVRERIEKTSELEQRLLAAAADAQQTGENLPSGLSVEGARLLAGWKGRPSKWPE